MKKLTINDILTEMERRFPGLGTEEEMNGGDTVEALCSWYEELRDSLRPAKDKPKVLLKRAYLTTLHTLRKPELRGE